MPVMSVQFFVRENAPKIIREFENRIREIFFEDQTSTLTKIKISFFLCGLCYTRGVGE